MGYVRPLPSSCKCIFPLISYNRSCVPLLHMHVDNKMFKYNNRYTVHIGFENISLLLLTFYIINAHSLMYKNRGFRHLLLHGMW